MARAGSGLAAVAGRLRARVERAVATAVPLWPYYVVFYTLGFFHLAEVHLLDPASTGLVHALAGSDVRLFAAIEAPVYRAIETLWTPDRVAAASAFYLAGFVGLLAWTPHLVALAGNRSRLKRALLTYPMVYLLALPGYLFLPQLNPYVALELADPFTPLGAGLESGYYLFTTPNNTFPSLHVAYTAALSYHLVRAGSRVLGAAAALHGTLLILSVVYVRVHWIGDVLGGLAVAVAGVALAGRVAQGEGVLGDLADRLDGLGQRGLGRGRAWWRRLG